MDLNATTAALAAGIVKQCRRLYSLGARSFLLMNMYPINQSPKYNLEHEVGHDLQDLVAESVDAYNFHLERIVTEWREEADDANIMLFDLNSFWKLVLCYPEIFGLTDITRYQMSLDGHRPDLGRMGFW